MPAHKEDTSVQRFCGIDWAEAHHDVVVVDADGRLLAHRRIRDDAAGYQQLLDLLAEVGESAAGARPPPRIRDAAAAYQQLLDLLAEVGDSAASPIPVAIETGRGLLVAC